MDDSLLGGPSTRSDEDDFEVLPIPERGFLSTGDSESGMGDMANACRAMADTLESCEEESEPRPEDDGFLIKQLLVNLCHQVAKPKIQDARMMKIKAKKAAAAQKAADAEAEAKAAAKAKAKKLAEAEGSDSEAADAYHRLLEEVAEEPPPPTPPPPPPPPATLKLLRCLRKVLDVTFAPQAQGGLQQLVLTFPPKPEEPAKTKPGDFETAIIAHNDYWLSYRDRRMAKWELDSSSSAPGLLKSAKGNSMASSAASFFPRASSSGSQRPTSSASTFPGDAAALKQAPRAPTASTNCPASSSYGVSASSWFRSSKSSEEKPWRTLSNFPHIPECPGTPCSTLSTGLPSGLDAGLSGYLDAGLSRMTADSQGFESLDFVVGPSTRLPRCKTPPRTSIPQWRDCSAKQRKDHRVRATVVPEFRTCCPACFRTSCNCVNATSTATLVQKAGRPRLKAIHSRLQLRPLELEAVTTQAMNTPRKKREQCEVVPVSEKDPPSKSIEEKEVDLQRAPKPRPILYARCATASLVQSEQWVYFSECQRVSKVPHIPRFLLGLDSADADKSSRLPSRQGQDPSSPESPEENKQRAADINLKNTQMTDRDLVTLIEPLRTSLASSVQLDLSCNGFSDQSVATFISKIACRDVRYLNISFCGAAGAAVDAVRNRMLSGWTRLQKLEIAGCRLADAAWGPLCHTLHEHGNLVTLNLAETGLGCRCERPVEAVMKFITSVPYLQYLDLSGNYFSYVGFGLVAAALRCPEVMLKRLDVSHNGCQPATVPRRWRSYNKTAHPSFTNPAGEVKPPEGVLVAGPDGKIGEDLPNFNPIILLCEALSENKTLLELRLAASFVDHSADCAILNALLANTTLQKLDLSGNPHGIEGLRAILRMMTARKQPLELCNISDFRDSDPGPGEIQVDLGAPSGHFELELSHAQHRSIVRWLMNAAVQKGIKPPDSAFVNVKFTTPQGKKCADQWCWKHERGWGVATAGRVVFDFDTPLNLEKQASGAAAVEVYVQSRRVPVTLRRFANLLSTFESLSTTEQTLLIKAMSDTVLLKSCHVTKLLEVCPEIGDVIVRLLFGHLLDKHPLLVFDLLGKHKDFARMFRKDARTAYFFNGYNPTNRYKLDLLNAMEHSVATRMQVITRFEAVTAKEAKRPDTSQHGNFEGVRNRVWDQMEFKTHFAQWTIPDHGTLSFDYVSAPHCGPKRKAETTADNKFKEITDAVEQSMCSPEDKLMALRSISRHLVLTPLQVCAFLAIIPNPSVRSPGAVPHSISQEKKSNRIEGYRSAALVETRRASAFQFSFARCRVEAFICLFSRCIDTAMLCNSECLMNPSLFSLGCVSEIIERLGRIRTFDVLNCSSPMSADITPSTTSSGVARMARTLQLLKEAERAEKSGGSSSIEVGRRYEINLSTFEEWTCARFLLALSKEESGQLKSCHWSEQDESLEEEGLDFVIPKDWFKKVPNHGELQLTYVAEKSDNEAPRRSLAESIFGWESR